MTELKSRRILAIPEVQAGDHVKSRRVYGVVEIKAEYGLAMTRHLVMIEIGEDEQEAQVSTFGPPVQCM